MVKKSIEKIPFASYSGLCSFITASSMQMNHGNGKNLIKILNYLYKVPKKSATKPTKNDFKSLREWNMVKIY